MICNPCAWGTLGMAKSYSTAPYLAAVGMERMIDVEGCREALVEVLKGSVPPVMTLILDFRSRLHSLSATG